MFLLFSGYRARGRADSGLQRGRRRARSRPSTERWSDSNRLPATLPASRHVQSAHPVESCKYTLTIRESRSSRIRAAAIPLTAFPQTTLVESITGAAALLYRVRTTYPPRKSTKEDSFSLIGPATMHRARPFTRGATRARRVSSGAHKERHYRRLMAWYVTWNLWSCTTRARACPPHVDVFYYARKR